MKYLKSMILIIVVFTLLFLNSCQVNQESKTQKETSNDNYYQTGLVPTSLEHPDGMLVIESEDDGSAAYHIPNIEYAKYGEYSLYLHALLPNTPNVNYTNCPVIIYIQGSGWEKQNPGITLPQLVPFTHVGYAVFSVEHRPSDVATAPAQVQDIKTAIRYIRANSDKYDIDPNKIGIWGDSSGGHLAALVGTSDGIQSFLTDYYPNQSSSVTAVIDFSGAIDFSKMGDFPSMFPANTPDSHPSRVIGGPVNSPEFYEKVQMYNPISYITNNKDIPPFLIVHGDHDCIVPFNQSVLLYEALRNSGKEVTFYKVKGADHGFRIWTPQIMKIVHNFFDKHLK